MYSMTDNPSPGGKKQAEVLALIPARGGSKSVPRKNIRLLGGRPLVAYSIMAALSAEQVDRVVVSTDCPVIAETAVAWGAEVPFLRPPELADDKALIGSAISHALDELAREGYHPDVVVTLYPTQPFRPAGLVDEMVSLCLNGAQLANTVKSVEYGGRGLFKALGDEYRLMDGGTPPGRRLVRNTGLVQARRMGAAKGRRHIRLVDDPVCNVDIDEPEDWFMAEGIIRRNLFPFEWRHDHACAGI